MKTSSFKQAIEAQFDCLSKKVIKRAVKKGYRDMKRREKHECLFSDIPDYEQSRFGELDKYESDYTVFNILGIEVWVEDDQLSEALKTLTEKKRNIILLSYFMDMSDSEISEFINGKFNYRCTDEDCIYLMIHIVRLYELQRKDDTNG